MLRTENIQYSIGRHQILKGITTAFEPGKINMILGPNGSGKSTFLKIFSGEINHFSGNVFYGSEQIATQKKEKLATYRAVMSQQTDLGFPLSVEEVVMMGRYPHFRFHPTKNDHRICSEVMVKLNLDTFRERNYLTLSGGEKQRVQYARVLAQVWETPAKDNRYLFLDEPLAGLDMNYQQEFLHTAKAFTGSSTVMIAIMHDINLAIQYADELYFMKEGNLVAQGAPEQVLTEQLIGDVFGVKAAVIKNPLNGRLLVVHR